VKILFVADLHANWRWFHWLLEQGPAHELVCIAGDLLDMFDPRGVAHQIGYLCGDWIDTWVRTGLPLAFCSGNHDRNDGWMQRLKRNERIVGDGENRLVHFASGERLLITTCPYDEIGDADSQARMKKLWKAGAGLRRNERAPWLVLHHEPPVQLLGLQAGQPLTDCLSEYPPDYLISGHIHDLPSRRGTFCERVGPAWCMNPGHTGGTLIPAHIVLDTGTHSAAWRYCATPDSPKLTERVRHLGS
jgi:Icc-related predicted phosphoesterase